MTTKFRFSFFLVYAVVLWGFTHAFGWTFRDQFSFINLDPFSLHPEFFWVMKQGFVFPFERVFIIVMFALVVVFGLRCMYCSYATPQAVPTKKLHRICMMLGLFLLVSMGMHYFDYYRASIFDYFSLVNAACLLGPLLLRLMSNGYSQAKS